MKHSRQQKDSNSSKDANFESRPTTHDRKTLQLCAQVRHALAYAISEAVEGEYGLTVVEVVPAPNTSHLLVFVQAFEELDFEESLKLQSELNSKANTFRSIVSESIHRRKTPGLSFQIVPRSPSPSS